jgi:hypothetical protein
MNAYDIDRLTSALGDLATGINTTAKGRKLQDLTEYILSAVPSVRIEARNKLDAARTGELDLWLRHDPRMSGFPFADLLVPVECKNEKEPASADEISRFAGKIRDTGGFDGLLVAAEGLAGSPGNSGHQQVTKELSRQTRIIVITRDDISRFQSTDDLMVLLQERYTELRMNQAYRSL